MSFLGKARKGDLRLLAEELGIEVSPDLRIIDLKKLILQSEDFDEEFVKELLTTVTEEREERRRKEEMEERKKKEEMEMEERKRKEEMEMEERKRKEEMEERKRKDEMEFELEKLRLTRADRSHENSSESSGSNSAPKAKLELRHVMQKFDEKESDISLYLLLFERQAEWAGIGRDDWVPHLLGLLPYDIVQLITREPAARAKNYDHVKELLHKRFKLSPERFRQKFVKHQKNTEATWTDFTYELQNYCNEWVTGLGITTYEQMIALTVVDQLKRRVPSEVRDHFLDEWVDIIDPMELASKLDTYENVRGNFKGKGMGGNQVLRTVARSQQKFHPETKGKKVETLPKVQEYGRRDPTRSSGPADNFERRRKPQCFECGSYQHLRPQCPKLRKKQEVPEAVNRVSELNKEDLLSPFTTIGIVNGVQIPILRDSGATIDIVAEKYVSPELYTGEYVWVQQALDLCPTRLPVAKVELSGNFGDLVTKAAVISDKLDKGRYLLGNRTASLITKTMNDVELYHVNAVETRSSKRKQETQGLKDSSTVPDAENSSESVEEGADRDSGDQDLLPTAPQDEAFSLLKVDADAFATSQGQSKSLQPLFEKAQKNPAVPFSKENFEMKGKLLMKKQVDKTGADRYLIVVPEEYRGRLKVLCHEGTSSHLGVTKTKDRLARYFFWPNCYKEVEEFVRTCDHCQRAGKAGEKRKAPMKLVPIIQEVFSKINVDTCGPLPTTPSGKRYLVTAMCLSSKYPDAVAVTDITSVSVIDALLEIFSRMGFPQELQCDQGTSFTSSLTTEFFERVGIKVTHSSVYHPQSNPVERFHRTLKRILRVLCLEAGPDWERQIHPALFALRTVTHESTGFTPAELVHGKNLRTPLTLLYEKWLEPSDENSSVVEYVFTLINRLKRCQEIAAEKMKESQEKRKTWYDKNAIKREFKEGDLVLVLATSKANKLAVHWLGPGKIESKISDTNYIVSLPGKKERSQIYHVNMLKPYYQRTEKVNYLTSDEIGASPELEMDFPCMDSNPNIFNFAETVQQSNLESLLEPHQIGQLQELLSRFSKSFSNEPGRTDLVAHDIELIKDTPVRSKPYRMSPRQTQILKAEIDKMLKYRVIEAAESDYTSPMIIVEVPGKEPRPCIDYRRLNEVIRTEYFPLPNIEQRVELVSSAKYITVLDLAKGYWQIPLTPKAQRLAAFVTSFGTYRPLCMPFGLKNAPYFFSRLMSELLRGYEEFAVPYLDDMAIFSNTWSEHIKHLECVLHRIQQARLHIKPSKCKFAQDHVKYLGHIVGQGTRRPAELKVQAIQEFPTPKTKTEVRAFMGLAGYYRQYIPMFSAVAAPLTETLKGRTRKGEIKWTAECENAFQELKNRLSNKPVLYAPDFSKEFLLQTDASDLGMGIVLSQLDESGNDHPILYLSKKFTDVEKRYSTSEKECAAIVYAVKKLHCYLDGHIKFKIQTDHNPLTWLQHNASSNPRLMRWALTLQPYNYEVIHRKGTLHKNADSLSRVRWPD